MTDPTPQTTPTRDEAVPFPAYGEINADDLGQAVMAARFGEPEPYEFDPNFRKGHQIVSTINFNSLNRIVTWFVKRALASAPAPASGDDPDAMLERALFANLRVGRVSAGTSNVTTNDGRRASIQFAVHEPGQRLALSPDIAAASSIYTAPASGGVDAVEALELARKVLSGRPGRSLADDLAIQRIDLVLAASLSPAATPVSEAEPVAPTPQQISDYLRGCDAIRRQVLEQEALAKPASSPAGGDREATYRAAWEHADSDLGWDLANQNASPNSLLAEQIARCKAMVDAALSQSTSAGR